MESVHGVDISWMTRTHKDQNSCNQNSCTQRSNSPPKEASKPTQNGPHQQPPEPSQHNTSSPKAIPPHRPGFSRSTSTDKTHTLSGSIPKSGSPSPNSRRNSWLSSISSKFSSSPNHSGNTTPPAAPSVPSPPVSQEPPVPTGPSAPKNAILQHGTKPLADGPYTPAPPKGGQPSFLQSAFRRLSSSGGQLSAPAKGPQHGLCERKVLNVDRHRERCRIAELQQSKLRRVAFCVDVEIASGPRYYDELDDISEDKKKDKKERKRLAEKGEGSALKNPTTMKEEKEENVLIKASGEEMPKEPEKEASEVTTEVKDDVAVGEKDTTKKKEKKKRSEEERKARKEKKRKLAEANGTLPVELIMNGSDSSLSTSGPGTPKTQASPTTDPVRIYRRCCQLRETPILKKITEQLSASMSTAGQPGVVSKLDLTGYWLQLADLITLGDYLAVVPIKELILENCGLTDEGVRVILAGLLAAKTPDHPGRRKKTLGKDGEVAQGGVVERLVLKNNNKIGRDGWNYILLFIHMCRSLKSMDLSKVPFPQPPAEPTYSPGNLSRTTSSLSTSTNGTTTSGDVNYLLIKAIGERLAGPELELLNMAECGLTTEQLGGLVDGVTKSGLRRLGIAGNNFTSEGMEHVARFIREGKCEGLDLGGNDLKDHLEIIANALDENNNLYALSLADCNLNADSLWTLFPALAKLKNFRFIDLSQNHGLFETEPSALSLLRRYAESSRCSAFLGENKEFRYGALDHFTKAGNMLAVR